MLIIEEKLSDLSSIRVGKKEKVFYVENYDDVSKLIKDYGIENLKFLGRGTNLIFSDRFIEKKIISTKKLKRNLEFNNNTVLVSGNINLNKVIMLSLNNNLKGLEKLAGIPGSIAGAVVNNAGAYGSEIGNKVKEVSAINENGDLIKLSKDELNFSYRDSIFRKNNFFITEVLLELESIENEEEKNRIFDEIKLICKTRKEKQPIEHYNCGSIFKNPKNNFAAYLIEKCGLKGYNYKGAEVSLKHANFIINKGKASSDDIFTLCEYVKNEVKKMYDIQLEYEVEFVGEFRIQQ